jgi:cation transport regulator ChaC
MTMLSGQADTVLYFAYGSNMSSRRLQARVPSATLVSRARLRGHQLRFHKHSLDDHSAKCDAYQTGDPDDQVLGVLFQFDQSEQAYLDHCEGEGYKIERLEVETEDGKLVEALTYLAVLIKPGLKPYHWYKQHVLNGAREHALPAEYITMIEAEPAQQDHDQTRSERELALYR